jgi:cytochrome b561
MRTAPTGIAPMSRYPAGLRRLHWLTVLLVAAAYLLIEQRGLFPRGSAGRNAMMQGHFWTGVSILAFTAWRIALRVRARGAVPPVSPALPAWQEWLSRVLHLSIYAFLVAMPLLGLAAMWSGGRTLELPFGGIALPSPLPVDRALAHRIEDLHGEIGEIFYWVFGLHIVAALYHHAWRRDDTLRRML